MLRRFSVPLFLVAGLTVSLLTACGQEYSAIPLDESPDTLASWQLLRIDDGHLRIRPDSLAYDLNSPLFSDYAQKLRTVWMPPGEAAVPEEDGSLSFPVGTVFSKTFYYTKADQQLVLERSPHPVSAPADFSGLDLNEVHLVETRILVRRADGWAALPYVWDAAQTEARLAIAGDIQALVLHDAAEQEEHRLNYVVPTRNECASCHNTDHGAGELLPIGPKLRHLNRSFASGSSSPAKKDAGSLSQLQTWAEAGFLSVIPDDIDPVARFQAGALDHLELRARSYLDINCGHCHNPDGPADTSALILDHSASSLQQLGLCKRPVAAGRGSGDRDFSIVPGVPEESIMVYRMLTRDPGEMMPELGRSLVHTEGVALIEAWIRSLPGNCNKTVALDGFQGG